MPVVLSTLVAQTVAFWILAIVMAAAAIGVVRSQNVVHAALYLVVVLAGGAAQFILLGQEFVAWVQVLVYIGAVIVLFLFGIMLTRAPIGGEVNLTSRHWAMGLVVAVPLAGVLAYTLIDAFGADHLPGDSRQLTSAVADTLFQQYLIPFEVVSVLLLAALVGAIVLARKE